jgi:hypothetical protein
MANDGKKLAVITLNSVGLQLGFSPSPPPPPPTSTEIFSNVDIYILPRVIHSELSERYCPAVLTGEFDPL